MDEHAATTVKLSPACITGTIFPNIFTVTIGVIDWKSHTHLLDESGSETIELTMKTEATAHAAVTSQ